MTHFFQNRRVRKNWRRSHQGVQTALQEKASLRPSMQRQMQPEMRSEKVQGASPDEMQRLRWFRNCRVCYEEDNQKMYQRVQDSFGLRTPGKSNNTYQSLQFCSVRNLVTRGRYSTTKNLNARRNARKNAINVESGRAKNFVSKNVRKDFRLLIFFPKRSLLKGQSFPKS